MGLSLRWSDRARRHSIVLTPGSRLRPPLGRQIVVRLAGDAASRSVAFSGAPISVHVP